MRLSSTLSCGLFAVSVFAIGCSGSSGNAQSGAGSAVTDIPESPVKDQGQTGNCWLYATGAWIESVEQEVPGNPGRSYSPAYWDYWDWHDQIMAGATGIDFGGYWGRAVDIVKRYGMVPMGTFIPDDANGAVSALAAMNQALATGALSTPAARQDSAQVLAALNAAFGISMSQAQALANTFGADGSKTFDLGNKASADFTTVTRAQDILAETPIPGGLLAATTLDQLIGTSANTANPDDRVGPFAWTAAYPPTNQSATAGTPGVYGAPINTAGAPASPDEGAGATDDAGAPTSASTAWRSYEIRLQTSLNAFASLPLEWVVAFPDLDRATGDFHRTTTQVADSESTFGYHESLLTDYQVTDVPGFGTLLAGTPATAPQKRAALDPSAQISFFRLKNSWGAFASGALLSGYDDVDTQYFEQPLQVTVGGVLAGTLPSLLVDVVLPAGF